MTPRAMSDVPYVGPKPFARSDAEMFFGRDSEASEILSLLFAHKACVLYAQSGAGKSSLLNAKLIPSLEDHGFQVLGPVRLHAVTPTEASTHVPNLYIHSMILALRGSLGAADQNATLLCDCLKGATSETSVDIVPRVLILDQFEEIFTICPQRWKDRAGFFAQLAEALWSDPLLRILFVMREDHIAKLDPYASSYPEDLRIRFRLERLQREAAVLAVQMPLIKIGVSEQAAERVAESIVGELLQTHVQTERGETVRVEGQFIEPVLLQVVCQRMWERHFLTASSAEHAAEESINDHSIASVDSPLTQYYENGLKNAMAGKNVTEYHLRKWFQTQLITAAGTRSFVFKGSLHVQGLPNHLAEALEQHRLIRSEYRAGAQWYELTHDSFINPIRSSNTAWFKNIIAHQKGRVITCWYIAVTLFCLLGLEGYLEVTGLNQSDVNFEKVEKIRDQASNANKMLGSAIADSKIKNYWHLRETLIELRGKKAKDRQPQDQPPLGRTYLGRGDYRSVMAEVDNLIKSKNIKGEQKDDLTQRLVRLNKKPEKQSKWAEKYSDTFARAAVLASVLCTLLTGLSSMFLLWIYNKKFQVSIWILFAIIALQLRFLYVNYVLDSRFHVGVFYAVLQSTTGLIIILFLYTVYADMKRAKTK